MAVRLQTDRPDPRQQAETCLDGARPDPEPLLVLRNGGEPVASLSADQVPAEQFECSRIWRKCGFLHGATLALMSTAHTTLDIHDPSEYQQVMQEPAYWSTPALSTAVGVDIGGTNTKLVLVDQAGTVRLRAIIPTPPSDEPQRMLAQISEAVLSFRAEAESSGHAVVGVGLATPQFTDGPDWRQRHANNMPGLEGYPIRPQLGEALGTPLAIVYDSGAAAIAEKVFGRGRAVNRLLTMSIGTGISMGAVTEDGFVDFNWGGTGDSGQIIVDPEASLRCPCGGRGCLESVAAAPAIRRAGIEAIAGHEETSLARRFAANGAIEASDVVAAAASGDAVAHRIVSKAGRYIGLALASYVHLFRPELIVLCGGVAQAGELLLEPIRVAVADFASPWYLERLRGIEISAFPLDGAAIGSAALVLHPELVPRAQSTAFDSVVERSR